MSDGPDRDSSRTDSPPRAPDDGPDPARLDVIADGDSATLTFAAAPDDDRDTTTAWVTADAALVVDLAEMR
jgi:hypothetical protein